MKTGMSILQDVNEATRLLQMTCDTLLLFTNDGTCLDMIVKTENNPYVNDQYTLIGKNIFEYFPEETVKELQPAFEEVVSTGISSNANYNLPGQDKLYFFKCIIHKYDEQHVLCQYRDITKRSQMKRKLQVMNERLVETEQAAKIGYWCYNGVTHEVDYCGYIGLFVEDNERHFFNLFEHLELVYPDDQDKFLDIFLNDNSEREVLEYRVIKDGKVYFLRLKVVRRYLSDKGEKMIEGYTQNIDEIISKWNELKMVTMAVNSTNDSIYATRMDGAMIFANHLCREQNMIPKDADITKFKAYDILRYFENESTWRKFIETLRENNNSMKFICNQPCSHTDILASDCSSLIIKDEYGEEVIWHIRRDISDQVRYENELKKAKERAEESDRLKSAFLSNMSHEIRTPLNAIVGFSAVMADIDDPHERKKYYSIIESSNQRLLSLINEVLDLSKIESGTVQFTYSSVSVNDLCREQAMAHQLYAGNVIFKTEIPDTELTIRTDRNRLTQILSNLIENAVKFTKEGSITIGYRILPVQVEFFVKDTGIGIAEENIGKVFNRFEKVDNFAPGTGLGLSICKTIVERMGGDISVVSRLGEGSVFSFRIPLVFGDPVQQPELELTNYQPSSVHLFGKGEKTVLVAEDIEDNFELIQLMIGDQFRLLHAHNGKEAIEMTEKYRPDLILMDLKMPEVNGVEALRVIRRKHPFNLPVIALSAYAFEEDREAMLCSGCNDFLVKPLDKSLLLSTIAKYV